MIVKTTTTVSFDPVKDYDLHEKFVKTENLSDWKIDVSTPLISYTKEWSVISQEREEE